MDPSDPGDTAAPLNEIAQSLRTGTAERVPALQEVAECFTAFDRARVELAAREREFGPDSLITERADEDALTTGYCLALALVDAVNGLNGRG